MSEDESSAVTIHPALTERATRRTAPLARGDFAFEKRIDGSEAGIEPGTACSEAIEAVFERHESIALVLESGTYRIETPIVLEEARSVGLLTKPGAEVRFAVPEGYDRALLSIRAVEHAVLAGIDIDQRATDAHPKIEISVEQSFLVEDVERRGVGDGADSGSRMPLCVEREDGIGVLRGCRLPRALPSLPIGPARTGGRRRGSARRAEENCTSRTAISRNTMPTRSTLRPHPARSRSCEVSTGTATTHRSASVDRTVR